MFDLEAKKKEFLLLIKNSTQNIKNKLENNPIITCNFFVKRKIKIKIKRNTMLTELE